MGNPVVHVEIRSRDPQRSQDFYRQLFGWTFEEAPADHVDGYAYVDQQSDRAAIHGGLSPLQGGEPMVTAYAEVENVHESLALAVNLGASIVEAPHDVPGVTIALFADPQGNVIGLAQPRR